MPVYFDECYSANKPITPNESIKFCEINSTINAVPDFLIWGDSHAQQYYPAFSQAAIEDRLNGLIATRQNCRPTLPNQYPFHTLTEAESCKEFNNKVNDLIKNSPNLKTVVLARLWLHGESIDQTIELVKSLVLAGKRVVILGAIPNPRYMLPTRWAELQVWNRTHISEIAVPRDKDELPAIDIYLKKQLDIENAKGSIILIDAMSHFCKHENCFYVENNTMNFFDMNHITEAKALEFTEEFKHALKQ